MCRILERLNDPEPLPLRNDDFWWMGIFIALALAVVIIAYNVSP